LGFMKEMRFVNQVSENCDVILFLRYKLWLLA
jgi:hypothetical protein